MFTGLIETTGTIEQVSRGNGSVVFTVRPHVTPYEVRIGDSVATNGVCLTVETINGDLFTLRAVMETISRTVLGDLATGSIVNLERAMLASARLDGHIVQGHVDTTASLVSIESAGDSFYYTFQPKDPGFMRYVAEKGSIAIDGISLTIARSNPTTFAVALIPHTVKVTSLSNKNVGSRVNIECDVLARYIEQLMKFGVQKESKDGELLNLLERNGF